MKDTTGEAQQEKIIRYSMMTPGEKERLDSLESRRGKESLQEDMFLEDMEQEKNLKQLLQLWDSYDFGEDYPAADRILKKWREKESMSMTKLPEGTFEQIRKDLAALFTGVRDEGEPETEEKPETPAVPGDKLFCTNCRSLTTGGVCGKCGHKKLRAPVMDDVCLLADLDHITCSILKSELEEAHIPYTTQAWQGAGLTMLFGNAIEAYRVYVRYRDLDAANELVQVLKADNEAAEPDGPEPSC